CVALRQADPRARHQGGIAARGKDGACNHAGGDGKRLGRRIDAPASRLATDMTSRLSVPKDRLKFVLLEGIHPSAVEALDRDGYTTVQTFPKALTGDALVEAIQDAHFLGIRSRTQLTAAVLAK